MGDGRQAHHTYRAAIVGCGGMGRNHARALTAMPEVELIGLSDIIQASLDRAGEEAGVAPNQRFTN